MTLLLYEILEAKWKQKVTVYFVAGGGKRDWFDIDKKGARDSI